jgi:hypothetical protein
MVQRKAAWNRESRKRKAEAETEEQKKREAKNKALNASQKRRRAERKTKQEEAHSARKHAAVGSERKAEAETEEQKKREAKNKALNASQKRRRAERKTKQEEAHSARKHAAVGSERKVPPGMAERREFETDPGIAQRFFYHGKHLDRRKDTTEAQADKWKVAEETKTALLECWHREMSNAQPICTCACCGVRKVNQGNEFVQRPLADLYMLRLPEAAVAKHRERQRLDTTRSWKVALVHNIVESKGTDGHLYWLCENGIPGKVIECNKSMERLSH